MNNFETDLIKNKTEKSAGTEKEIKIDTAELSQEALDAQKNLATLNATGKEADIMAYQKVLDSIEKDGASSSKEKGAEARAEKRMEVVSKIMQMIIDNLESKLDKKGFGGFLSRQLGVEDEIKEHISHARVYQSQGLDRLNVPGLYAFDKPGVHTDKNLRKEVADLIKAEVSPEDQELFTDRRNLVGHQLTNVSAG